MNICLLIGTIFILILELKNKDFFSPSTICVIVDALSAVTFFLGSRLHLIPDTWSNWYFTSKDYSNVTFWVLLFYFLLSLTCFFAGVKARKRRKTFNNKNRRKIDLNISKILTSSTTMIGLFCLLLLLIFHFFSVNLSKLVFYTNYLEIREPILMGLRNQVAVIIHTILPSLGLIICPLTLFYIHKKRYDYLFIIFPIFIYCLIFTISLSSRLLVAYFVVLAITEILLHRKINLFCFLYLLFAAISYGVVIYLRVENTGYGIVPFIEVLIHGKFLVLENYIFSFFNSFSGGFVMAEAFQRVNVQYPIQYKLLSFSPFPSTIDGFNNYRMYENRIFIYGPFSSFAEAFHFGWIYFICLIIFLNIVVYQITRMWISNSSFIIYFLIIPFYYAVIRMQSYPIRSSFRWLLLAFITALIINKKIQEKEKKVIILSNL